MSTPNTSLVRYVHPARLLTKQQTECLTSRYTPVIPLADLTALVEGLREISGEVVCDGPGCNRCEDELSHMPTPGARTAQLLLAQLEAHREEG